MDLTTLIIGWVVVTTAVVVLGYMRMTMGLHDVVEVHLSGDRPPVDPDDMRRTSRMGKIDRVGIPLTVLSVLMAIAIVLVWAAQQGGTS